MYNEKWTPENDEHCPTCSCEQNEMLHIDDDSIPEMLARLANEKDVIAEMMNCVDEDAPGYEELTEAFIALTKARIYLRRADSPPRQFR